MGISEGKVHSQLCFMLRMTGYIKHLDQNKEICCIFFDFQKAFDTVPHRRLNEKLKQLNLHPSILTWLCSYLAMRQQSVVVNGTSSHSIPVISGVPQGSVLGPLLFLIYIDSISTLQLSEVSNLTLYADDMLLYKTHLISCGLCRTPTRHQSDLWLVCYQLNDHKMQMHVGLTKTKCKLSTYEPQ